MANVRQRVREMIGRWAAPLALRVYTALTVDWTRVDYAFWSRLRRGKEKTYELGALFAKPMAEIIAAWSLGKGVNVSADHAATDEELADFMNNFLQAIINWSENSLSLGDAYLVVNPDASLTAVTPDMVEILTSPKGSQNVVGHRITSKLAEVTYVDEYRREARTLTTRTAGQETIITFPNLTGRLPVIHLPNDPDTNEIYGHPIYEGLLKLFAEYDDVLSKGLQGVKIMGNPIPVAEGLEDPEQAREMNATDTETYTDANGNSQTRPVIDFSRIDMLFFGKGGSFKFASPGKISEDTSALLKKLFYLMLEHSQIPEWAWGGAIASSKASVEAQMPAFERFIDGRRRKLEPALRDLLAVWLATRALINPAIRADLPIQFEWPPLSQEDKAVRLDYIKYADESGKLTDETALRLTGLVDDPAAEVEAAREESDARREQMQDAFDRSVDTELQRSMQTDNAQEQDAA